MRTAVARTIGANALLLGALRMGIAAGNHAQLVMESTFTIETSTCEGLGCRKQFIGGAEAHGLGAHSMCTNRVQYVHDINVAPTQYLFELLYTCRRPDGVLLMTEEECGAKVCLDAGTNPRNSEITYQISFEHERLSHNIVVDAKLYFSYMSVDQAFYEMREEKPTFCYLQETCHRECADDEAKFEAVLEDSVGDGWCAGALGKYDHFWIDPRSSFVALNLGTQSPSNGDAVAGATTVRHSYTNTLLGGFNRTVPLCLADGEYLFSTQFTGGHTDGATIAESKWLFCLTEGGLSGFAHVLVKDGACAPIVGWDRTVSPAVTPIDGVTPAPTLLPTDHQDDDQLIVPGGDAPEDAPTGSKATGLTVWEILGIAVGCLGAVVLAVGIGKRVQKQGRFSSAGATPAVAAASGAPTAPDPNVDEFAP